MKTINYRVYTHTTPDGLKYVGMTSQDLSLRWHPSKYITTSLLLYIKKYGWKNIQHEVIYTCYDRKEALEIEDEMIQYWSEKGVCINKQRSGLIRISDVKAYNKTYNEEHREEMKARDSTPERKIYCRVKSYNRYYPDSITITPSEAKNLYLQYNIIPSVIKSDDMPNAIIYDPSVSVTQLPLF